jgi:hypothetical protein
MRCSSCGNEYSGYHCQSCAALKTIEREAERNREHQSGLVESESYRRREEFEAQAHQTAAIARLNALVEIERTEALAHEAKLQTREAQRQTKILLEQSVTTEEAFDLGYGFIQGMCSVFYDESAKNIYPHTVFLKIDGDAKIVIKSITPDFETPKLAAAYTDGVKKRFSDGFLDSLVVEECFEKAVRHGFDLVRNFEFDCFVFLSTSDDSPHIVAKTEAFDFPLDLRVDRSTGLMKNANRITALFEVTENHFYEEVRTRYAQGVKERLAFENEPKKCRERLDQFRLEDEQVNATNAQVELQKKELKQSADLFQIIRFVSIAALLVYVYVQFNSGHWFLSIFSFVTAFVISTLGTFEKHEIATNSHTLLAVATIAIYLGSVYWVNEHYNWFKTTIFGLVACGITGFINSKINDEAITKRFH